MKQFCSYGEKGEGQKEQNEMSDRVETISDSLTEVLVEPAERG